MSAILRQPTFFLPHGAGPCFFMDWQPPGTWTRMQDFLETLAFGLPAPPVALLVVSAHWEAPQFTVNTSAAPTLWYDYQGFPPHTYALQWPAHGAPALAGQVMALLQAAGIPATGDAQRGFDHGVFIPLKLVFPHADIPVVQLSLRSGLDPAAHLAAGRALSSLRDAGVLIIGSGMSFHNMRRFRMEGGDADPDSLAFDQWLGETVALSSPDRDLALREWTRAPGARASHPREEHLLPLHVVAGAAGADAGVRVLADQVLGSAQSAFRFG